MVCILTTFATYKFFWSKITASCVVMCVTLIRLPLDIKIVTNIIYFLADMCIFENVLIIYINKLIWVRENPKFAFIL